MSLLLPDEPQTPFQHSLNRIVAVLLAAAGVGLGMWEARQCAAVRFGYAASYSYVTALALAAALFLIGLPLLVYWRTRWVGVGVLVAGILSCASFYAGMAVLLKLDRVAWRHEPPPVHFGPDQRASVVVYFRKGTTNQQIEDFNVSILQADAQPRHKGLDFPAFVSSYLRLLPNQANGHQAIALTFRNDAPPDQVNAYLTKIKNDERVDKIFLGISPESIHDPPSNR